MPKKLAVIIAIMGSLPETKSVYGALTNSMATDSDVIILDNGASVDEGQVEFFQRFVEPRVKENGGEFIYVPFDNNIGVVKAMQYAYENCAHDILAFLHNDVYIYEYGWDAQTIDVFDSYDKVGLVGFFGAEGVGPQSGRFHVWNNMLEAEIHGWRNDQVREVAVLDGLSMFASREMLDARDGVDTDFDIHHFYDLDLSLESIDRGFKNYVLPTYIHHQSGQTACKPMFQNWANRYIGLEQDGEQTIYFANHRRWVEKWSDKLPWKVGDPWPR